MIDALLERLSEATAVAPLLGLAVGVLLGLSPLALPMVPAVVATVSAGRLDERGVRHRLPLLRLAPSIIAFTAGMNGVLGLVGLLFATVAVALTRASIVLHLLAAAVLGVLGLRLLLRRSSLCNRAKAIPPRPGAAFLYGIGFSVAGCPACGPIAIGIGSATALVAGPLVGLATVATFVLGHAVVLIAAAGLGARLLPSGTENVPWLRLDLIVGAMFLLASAYYLYRVLSGEVTTKLPGEPGSGLLP